jgi:hypothetical protein
MQDTGRLKEALFMPKEKSQKDAMKANLSRSIESPQRRQKIRLQLNGAGIRKAEKKICIRSRAFLKL